MFKSFLKDRETGGGEETKNKSDRGVMWPPKPKILIIIYSSLQKKKFANLCQCLHLMIISSSLS